MHATAPDFFVADMLDCMSRLLAVLSLAFFAFGCQSDQAEVALNSDAMKTMPESLPPDWSANVRSIRVNPLSRVLPPFAKQGAREGWLEVRVECCDVDQDVVRTGGVMRISTGMGDGERVKDFDLSLHQVNLKCWDIVTRTYFFKIPVTFVYKPEAIVPNAIQVRVVLRLPDQSQFVATAQVVSP